MRGLRRRQFLAAGVAAAGALTGCLGGGIGAGSSGESDGMTVQGVEVRSSPGEQIPVMPSGQVVLLDFWATWCAPCKPQMKELRTIRQEYPDVHMLSITNEGDVEAVKSFWREYEGTWPVATDTELKTNERFGVNRIPTMQIYTAGDEREKVWDHTGLAAADSIAEQLDEATA